MFAVMAPPIFSFAHDASSLYRPAVPSPLSSSPIRASPTSPQKPEHNTMSSPLAPREPNICPFQPRDIQSSPISSSQQKSLFEDKRNSPKFKYAGRDVRPNPVGKKREDKQEGRRRLFLQNVRKRADDKAWERRGGENELLKLEWSRLVHELHHAKNSDLEGFVMPEEIEDDLQLLDDATGGIGHDDQDLDAMMLDAIEQEEEAEIDALLTALPTNTSSQTRPESPHLYSDDDDYDEIFMDFISSQPEQSSQSTARSQDDVEMS